LTFYETLKVGVIRLMTKRSKTYTFTWEPDIAGIDKARWDALARPLKTPFLEWEWLRLMESSGSITAETGWYPSHLAVWSGDELVAAAPLYRKLHSEGEFIDDYVWADLAYRLGIAYYPKLVGMSPVTPVQGYRFLVSPEENATDLTGLMLAEIERYCRENRISGYHFLFADPDWAKGLPDNRCCAWLHPVLTWKNRGYQSFSDYLALFNANQRRNIIRERRRAAQLNITFRQLTGDEITPAHMEVMYRYYVGTNSKFGSWGCRYLTHDFFRKLPDRFRERLMLLGAFTEGADDGPVALGLFVYKGERLYGRYWGCREELDTLHFNTCYYSPIEWAIARGIREFDPGIGGGHKVRRGFEAVPGYSLHRFLDLEMETIMKMNIDEINRQALAQIDRINQSIPFAEKNG
jgi:predicted N-acyltransferase